MRAPCWIVGSDRFHCVVTAATKRVPRLLIDALIKHSCALAAIVDNAAWGGLGGDSSVKTRVKKIGRKKRSCPFLSAHEKLLLTCISVRGSIYIYIYI